MVTSESIDSKSWPSNSSFRGSCNKAGSLVIASVTPEAICLALSVIPANKMLRNIATPSVPPICRKKVDEDVATPMSLASTAFWLAIVRV